MNAGIENDIKKAYFISPIVNMEKLITDMICWANVSEEELKEKQLEEYILDLIDNRNSLSIGLRQNGVLIGAALGCIMH